MPQTPRNAPKHELRVQWGWIGCVHCNKFWHYFVARTFALVAPVDPVLHRASCSYETIPNAPKTLCNAPKHEFRVQWGGLGCEKSRRELVVRTFALIAPVHTILHWVSCSYEKIANAPKHYATHQNMCLGSNGWIGCIRCEKSRCDFVARTFVLIAPVHPVLHRVSCSYETILNAPKHYANTPKNDSRVQWGRLGALVVKNPDVTLWHELLH